MSDYRLQVVHVRTGQVVHGWQPGDRVELDLVEELVTRVGTKRVGLVAGVGKVQKAVREAAQEMLLDLKGRV